MEIAHYSVQVNLHSNVRYMAQVLGVHADYFIPKNDRWLIASSKLSLFFFVGLFIYLFTFIFVHESGDEAT